MPKPHRPGQDPLLDERLEEIRATADTPELRDVLGELDRIRPLLDKVLADNGKLLDEWARNAGLATHPFLGVFCRTCRAEVQPGSEGCPRHSPTVIGRDLFRMHEESRTLLDDEERNRRAFAMLDAALPLLAAVLNPVDHRDGCRPHDCRCGCDRRQNCQDCYRCVCWRSECCAEKAIRWHAEVRWEELSAKLGLRCSDCRTPTAELAGPPAPTAACWTGHAPRHRPPAA
ncbi:hypothetical protein OG800_50560 (plasmid) [Streptomyces sp. NBC_00445]|uniref:hypothetical protein n=1 Tax=Streptomyces sp. NBC_00445 TaxID=2975745 RepID=UPI002E1AC9C3